MPEEGEANRSPFAGGVELDTYTVERALGNGGYGITYLARERFTNRRVAIKELMPRGYARRTDPGEDVSTVNPADQAEFAHYLAGFREEAKRLVDLEHPNVVRTLRYFEKNGTGYLVMAYVEGDTLQAQLEQQVRLPERRLRELLSPLLDGLAYIHGKGFLHRDIKPANILIRSDGTPVLLDFGAARQLLHRSVASRVATGILTEGYAPPEQYGSGPGQGEWTDLYALGATLYRCMCAALPTPSRLREEIAGRRESDPVALRLEQAGNRYSPELVKMVRHCLELAPAKRPQSVAELRRAYALAPPRPRRRVALIASVAGALVLASAAALLASGAVCGSGATWSWSSLNCVANSDAPSREWVVYRPEGAGFRVELPGKPKISIQMVKTDIGSIPMTTATVGRGTTGFVVAHSDYPETSEPLDVEKVLNGARDGQVRNRKLRSERRVTIGNLPARHIIFEADGNVGVTRLVLAGRRLYQQVYIGPLGSETSREVAYFIDSFALTDR